MPAGQHSSAASRGGGMGEQDESGQEERQGSTAAERAGIGETEAQRGGAFGGFEGERADIDQADVTRARELETQAAAAAESQRVAKELEFSNRAPQPGDPFSKRAFDDAVAFAEFSAATDEGLESFGQFLGFGPDVTIGAIRGAKDFSPEAFEAGASFELAASAAGVIASTAGLPARLAVSAIDQAVEAFSDPAFSLGMQSVTTSAAAGSAVGLGLAVAGMPDVGRAVKIGLNLAGISMEASERGLAETRVFDFGTPTGADGISDDSEREAMRDGTDVVAEQQDTEVPLIETSSIVSGVGAVTEQGTTQVRARRRGRGALRIRRT